jgi:excisionase family DNA binding protein
MMRTTPIALRTTELSDRLGLSIQTIYKLAREGKIPHIRKGRTLLFLDHEVMQWLNEGRVEKKTTI